MAEHPYCDEGKVLREHGEDIAVLTSKVDELERVKIDLFKITKDIGDTSLENQIIVKDIKKKIETGDLIRPLEKKIDALCNEFAKTRKKVEDHSETIEERVVRLEQNSWVTDIMAFGAKKLLIAALIGAMVIGLVNTAWWGLAKNYIFKESPKQQQFLYLQMKEGGTPVVTTTPVPGSVPVPVQDGNNIGGNNKK